jgi:hypothetical protein
VHDQLDGALAFMLSEKPGGPNHDILLGADWRRVGVGIVNPDARMYSTSRRETRLTPRSGSATGPSARCEERV